MEFLIKCCAGLDVHKATVTACVRRIDGGRVHSEVRTFGTMTRDLKALAEWMGSQGVTDVAMESTGVLWKPVYNILDGRFKVKLCNAQHLKQVPGRKTDIADCEWIAQLLQHGLLRGSFVPDRVLREIRDLTRHQAQIVAEKTRAVNRIHKILEDANLKLGAVATDIMGVSGRAMLDALLEGERDPERLAKMGRGKLKRKLPELRLAMEGHVTEHHVFMLRTLYEHFRYLEGVDQALERQIEASLALADKERGTAASPEEGPRPFAQSDALVRTMPGMDQRSTRAVLAEIGTDMGVFPTEKHISSWTGICPGNDQSAGKRRSGKTRKGNRWLRRILCQCAWSLARSNTYFGAQYRRLVGRRGKKRAILAVAHSMLVAIHAILKTGRPYHELGPDYFDRLNSARLTRYYVRRLESMGHTVVLNPAKEAS